MDARRVPRKAHTVFAAKLPAGGRREQPAGWLWDALCERYPALASYQAEGLGSVDLDGSTTVRWAGRTAAGAFACEVIDLEEADCWEAFIVDVGDGNLRTGWRRRGPKHEAPGAWEDAAVQLVLGPQAHFKSEPNFLALAAAICADGGLTVLGADVDERNRLAEESNGWKDVAARQAVELRSLRMASRMAAPTLTRGSETFEPVPFWTDLADMQQWADQNVDRLVVMPRAIAEAKKSIYSDPRLVYDVLEMLAETYRKVKLSELDRSVLKKECERLGVSIGGSVDPARAGMTGGEYHVSYGGRKRFVDQHVSKGTSRDERFCLRIYFFWCNDTKRPIVGWLPSHLTNSKT
jgi:hypothetical protein